MSANTPSPAQTFKQVLTPLALFRLALGWLAFLFSPFIPRQPSTGVALIFLAALIGIIILCSFGVVAQAEKLAERLGDPYGTIILTLSIVVIEVVLISAVMLGPGEHQTVARDSIMTVSMIIMNLVAGVALVVMGSSSSSAKKPNSAGVRAYLGRIAILGLIVFYIPVVTGTYDAFQSGLVAVGVAVCYARFLQLQLGKRHQHFQEVGTAPKAATRSDVVQTNNTEIALRSIVLLLTAIPIVMLAHNMASLLELMAGRFTLPVALPAAIIAIIVFLPETITTIKAALRGESQRVSNLCHGALLSTFGLTIPSVLVIGDVTRQTVILAESTANLLLFAATIALTLVSFRGRPRVRSGIAHLALFVAYTVFTFVLV